MIKAVELRASPVTLDDRFAAARCRWSATVGKKGVAAMRATAQWVAAIVEDMGAGRPAAPIYSINTGFGSLGAPY